MNECLVNTSRKASENYLLTLASRLKSTRGVIVLVAEGDGRFTNHQANYENVPWATMAGNISAVSHEILNKLSWSAVAIDGGELPEEE